MLRGYFWPQSVYGVVVASQWRWLEHAAWVIFEDIFLVVSCRRSDRGDEADGGAHRDARTGGADAAAGRDTTLADGGRGRATRAPTASHAPTAPMRWSDLDGGIAQIWTLDDGQTLELQAAAAPARRSTDATDA